MDSNPSGGRNKTQIHFKKQQVFLLEGRRAAREEEGTSLRGRAARGPRPRGLARTRGTFTCRPAPGHFFFFFFWGETSAEHKMWHGINKSPRHRNSCESVCHHRRERKDPPPPLVECVCVCVFNIKKAQMCVANTHRRVIMAQWIEDLTIWMDTQGEGGVCVCVYTYMHTWVGRRPSVFLCGVLE